MTTRRDLVRFAVLAGLLLAPLPASPSLAGELVLAWEPIRSTGVAGYDVEVLDEAGALVRVVDAGRATRLVVTDLDDGVVYRFRVRPYDATGRRASEPSRAIASTAAPVVERIGPAASGEAIAVHGRNFMAGVRLVPRRPGVHVLGVRRLDATLLEVSISSSGPLAPDDLLAVNPVLRSVDYLRLHPEVMDLDGSGSADAADRDLLARALAAGGPLPPAFDLSGDGRIDAHDSELMAAALADLERDRARPAPASRRAREP